jgi:hypothetical protein
MSGSRETIESRLPDAFQNPDVKAAIGLWGETTETGERRIYYSQDFGTYLDVQEESLLIADLGDSTSPHVMIGVHRDTDVTYHTQNESHELIATFLDGGLTLEILDRSNGQVVHEFIEAVLPWGPYSWWWCVTTDPGVCGDFHDLLGPVGDPLHRSI